MSRALHLRALGSRLAFAGAVATFAACTGGSGSQDATGRGVGGNAGSSSGSAPPMLGPLLPTNVWPRTIPSLREWHAYGASGDSFTLDASSSIVIPSNAPSDLTDAASVLREDLAAMTGQAPAVVKGTSGGAGDITIATDLGDPTAGDEGYVLAIDTRAEVHANTTLGAFWGTRTLLQMLAQSPTRKLSPGAARDWPSYAERGFMIDNGRAYFTPEWLEAIVRDLSYLKMNLFHWHLSDSQGFRIESPSHPEVMSPEYLTRAQVGSIVALAQRYHVEIVPEIDMPGHMDAILAKHPDLVAAQSTYPGQQLDYTQDAARNLATDLIQESISLFPGRYWHLGCDEFDPYFDAAWNYAQMLYGGNPNIGGKDVAIRFVNQLAGVVEANGKVPRMWNDVVEPRGAVEALDSKMVLDYWKNSGTTVTGWVDAGHALLNCNMDCTYSADEATLLSSACAPTHFADGTVLDAPSARGMSYHVWCDPASVYCPSGKAVADGTRVPLRALSQITWGTAPLFGSASGLDALSNAIGRAPGFTF